MQKLAICLLFSISLGSYALPVKDINVDKKLTEFTVMLPANPTTGYQWSVTGYDKSVLSLLKSQYLPSPTTLVGSGGQMVFKFVLRPGRKNYPDKTDLTFNYARSWEPGKGTPHAVTVHFIDMTKK